MSADIGQMTANAAAGSPHSPDALTRSQFEALAADVTADIPGLRVEVECTTQDSEGGWFWAKGEPALWSERFRSDVRYRARVVSDWMEVR